MPLTRPEEISDCIRLANKLGREMGAFVAEDGAVDAVLAAGIDEFAPNEKSVGISGSQDALLAGARE